CGPPAPPVRARPLSAGAGGASPPGAAARAPPPPPPPRLQTRVRESYLAVDTVVYQGGRQGALLLIGVE
ncbi:hypothetical protein, partial [Streptomyces sp. NPDC127190]|uniref:hypothetical protein n=1 Tax=Streptomyces sp. NPDC127190 TaxID=3345387 RepID=UPI003632EE25